MYIPYMLIHTSQYNIRTKIRKCIYNELPYIETPRQRSYSGHVGWLPSPLGAQRARAAAIARRGPDSPEFPRWRLSTLPTQMVMPPRGDPPHYHATEAVPMRGRSIMIYSMCTYKYCISNTQRVITVMYNSM